MLNEVALTVSENWITIVPSFRLNSENCTTSGGVLSLYKSLAEVSVTGLTGRST